MKEAAGEANMTVITIVLIGVVAAVGAILIPRLLDNVAKKSACNEMGGQLTGTNCVYKNSDGTEVTCITRKCSNGEWVCGKCPTT